MTVAATLTLTLDPDLLDRFVAEADAAMRPARDAEIDRALREADDPEVKRIPHEEAIVRLSRQRAEMVHRARDRTA